MTEASKYELHSSSSMRPLSSANTIGSISDGYHTFDELYEYRTLYMAAFLNELAKKGVCDVHKSKRHSTGELCFGCSGWFIVMAELPTGQISNHCKIEDWDLFNVPVKEFANKWDHHTPKDVAQRIRDYLLIENNGTEGTNEETN